MSLEPQRFFIGVIDLFAVMLPGALLAYATKDELGPRLLGDEYDQLGGAEATFVFLFAAYLLGHFIFLVGSFVLDTYAYDRIRKATDREITKALADPQEKVRLPWDLTRRMSAFLIEERNEDAVERANGIKARYLDPLKASRSINTFQWCKALLALEEPEALSIVQRFEADSKFFRSLVVLLAALTIWGPSTGQWIVGLISLFLMPVAFWRYFEQRLKGVTQAYWFIITMEGLKQIPSSEPKVSPAHEPTRIILPDGLNYQWGSAIGQPSIEVTHAGGVVVRHDGESVEYLLVTATRAPHEWVLPKGQIEHGERPTETAVREVREEAGVWACIRADLGTSNYRVGDKPVAVSFFLMEAVEDGQPIEEREIRWFPFDKALAITAQHAETQDVIKRARGSWLVHEGPQPFTHGRISSGSNTRSSLGH